MGGLSRSSLEKGRVWGPQSALGCWTLRFGREQYMWGLCAAIPGPTHLAAEGGVGGGALDVRMPHWHWRRAAGWQPSGICSITCLYHPSSLLLHPHNLSGSVSVFSLSLSFSSSISSALSLWPVGFSCLSLWLFLASV